MLRTEVIKFAEAMEVELKENDHKHGWKECSLDFLIDKLDEEVAELKEAAKLYISVEGNSGENEPNAKPRQEVLSEAADVGNIAMMIADICDALQGRNRNVE